MSTVSDRLERGLDAAAARLQRRFTMTSALAAFFLLNLEIGLLATYVLVSADDVLRWGPLLFPFVWINVSIAAVAWTDVGPATRRQRVLAVGIAVAYFLLLGYFGGLYTTGTDLLATDLDLTIAKHPPGWDPMLTANTPLVNVSLVFYKLVGYLALTYLVYATVIDAARSAVGGVVGLFACVSCTWPALGSVLAGVFGGGSALAAAANERVYLLSTVVFVLTVALLYWRPGFDRITAALSP